jgi:glycosyltransferase involved in cell wall biosynthesis
MSSRPAMLNDNSQVHLRQPAPCAAEPPLSREDFSALRVLALLPFLVEGALSLAVLRALRALGATVVLASCATDSGYTRDLADDFSRDNCLIDLASLRVDSQLDLLRREITERRINLVLQIGAFSLYPLLPYLKGQVPVFRLVDILYNEVHTLNHFLYEPCFDGVIVESEYMARYMGAGTLKSDPCVLVKSGVDLEFFTPGSPSPDPGELRIGYIGRLSPEKNPLGFIDIFESLAERMPNLSAIIVGNGPMVEDVRKRVAESPAASRLVYLGRLKSIVDTLQTLDALFVPSTLDGRPNVVMEANACGVPVIAAPVGGIPELIEEGVNGYLATPAEIDRIASVLTTWAADPALRRLIRSTSRQTAEARFDRRRMILDYAVAFRDFGGPRALSSGSSDAQGAFQS